MRQSTEPTATVWSASASTSAIVPATGEGTSASTLSVEISTSGSSTATVSPGFTRHSRIVPSATESPISGKVTSTARSPGGLAGRGAVALGLRLGGRGVAALALLDLGQHAAHLHGLVHLHEDLGERARGGGGDLGVHLVGGHLDQRLVGLDGVALLLEPGKDGSLRHRLSGGGHRHLNGRLLGGHRCPSHNTPRREAASPVRSGLRPAVCPAAA